MTRDDAIRAFCQFALRHRIKMEFSITETDGVLFLTNGKDGQPVGLSHWVIVELEKELRRG